jgi:hypothetical protein
MVTLTGSDSLTWSVHVALDSVAIERLVMAAPSANLVVRVIDSTSGTGVPYANVEINGKTLVSSEEGLVSASVDPGTPCVVRVRALGWAIQAPDTITLVGGQLRDLRHVMQGQPPVVKY